ncbi:hypothetical protein ACWDA7_36580 [Streptomyces sp. NPDC001156]
MSALRALLPKGDISEAEGQAVGAVGANDGRPPRSLKAELIFDDGHGPAKISVALSRFPVPVPSILSQCPDTAYHPYSKCTIRKLNGGADFILDKSPANQNKPSGVQRWTALLTTRHGDQILATEINARHDTDVTVSRPIPPIPAETLTTIVTSPTWRPFLTALSVPPSSNLTPQTKQVSAQQITGFLRKLLPTGLRVADEGGADGFGHVTVDDGQGKSLVAMNVQRWQPDDPAISRIFKTADILPDGTRLTTHQGRPTSGGKGLTEWTVDTFRKDGLRVVISTVNARAYGIPATRKIPALTTSQLRQIALDPLWAQLSWPKVT